MANLASLERKLRDHADQAGDNAAAEVARRIAANAPRDTGALAQGTTVERTDGSDWIGWTIRTVADSSEGFDYATAQEEGTGIYRPGGSPIVPVNAKALRFFWKKTGRIEFRVSVKGTPPTYFFSHAVRDWPQLMVEAFA
jgi:hypothetical protein